MSQNTPFTYMIYEVIRVWRDEQEYFSDAEVVQYCIICGEELYHGDEVYYNNNCKCYYCSDECVKIDLEVEDRDEKHEPVKCTHCGKTLRKYDEVTISEGEVFCDLDCVLKYNDIERMEM